MKIVVIDGQGGRIGSLVTARLCKEQLPNCELYAIGTNAAEAGTYVKLIVMMMMVLLTNPISNHAMCKAACNTDALPSSKMVINDYKEDDPE